MTFNERGDNLGGGDKAKTANGIWIVILNGRIGGAGAANLQAALREAAALDCCEFLMTPNQNLMLSNVDNKDRQRLQKILQRYDIDVTGEALSGLKKNAMACVALPTCPLAMAEAERYLPRLITLLEDELQNRGLNKDDIIIRMTVVLTVAPALIWEKLASSGNLSDAITFIWEHLSTATVCHPCTVKT